MKTDQMVTTTTTTTAIKDRRERERKDDHAHTRTHASALTSSKHGTRDEVKKKERQTKNGTHEKET